ncbi:pilus assembly protein FlpE [Actinotalea sp. M2MS4P-6]|uniref:pilus assembly protein FlpE n=1 Tax=Actinotalea sp. M2MS4P-6 TaxID=2983762 RepID=UPI0021E36FA0|nr:pilus assembly protein FlpE [Actinotalea sp. M2MS4P-6]MCV2394900.1 pilus assembly protein FlpE [Actinotalea sp. M2MS4P-6]
MQRMVVVSGAVGGVGASTFAALIAAARATSGPTALVDLGPGGGLDVLLGIEAAAGSRWPELAGVHGRVAAAELTGLLPRWRGIEVLSAARDGAVPGAEAVLAVCTALVDGGVSVVVDLPGSRVLGDLPSEVPEALVGGLGGELVLVAGQDVLGVAGLLALRRRLTVPAQLVLRRRRSRVAPIEAAHVSDLPLLGLLPGDRRLADAVDRGLGPVAGRRLRRAVARVSHRLASQ